MRKKLLLGAACAALLVFLLLGRRQYMSRMAITGLVRSPRKPVSPVQATEPRSERWKRRTTPTATQPAAEIVQEKVAKFARSRRDLAGKLGNRKGVSMTPEINAFFAAVESGNWDRIENAMSVICAGDRSAGYASGRSPEVSQMWPAIIDAYGVAEQAHLMPPQTLLDYGYSILDALRPGMAYVGGTDSSRWVPALLNDTEQGDKHRVITQNGLADSHYLEYLNVLFGDQMNTLTDDEFHAVYDNYAADALRRFEHDQNFPDETRQLRHAENVKEVEGKTEINGRDAVFEMNERLLNKLLEKNPDLSFAIGESVPLPGTYADAVPLGPLMELRANAWESFTAERANESVEYWRETAETVLAHPESSQSEYALRTYSHDASASGNLLAAHGFNSEAEEAYRLSQKLFPGSPEAVVNLANLYERNGRTDEAQRLMQDFVREHPSERKTLRDNWGIEVQDAAQLSVAKQRAPRH